MKLRDALREADEVFRTTQLPDLALRERRRRSRRAMWVVLGACAVVVVAVFIGRPGPIGVEDVQLEVGDRYVPKLPRGVEIVAATRAELRRDHQSVRVLAGEVTFSVAKRASGESPVRIEVSHGTIEVVGTHFTIRQWETGGEVVLHEGLIRFGAHELRAGETFAWPETPAPERLAPPAPTEEPPPSPRPPPSPSPSTKRREVFRKKEPTVIRETDAVWLLEEVEMLRSRGEYDEAVRLLDKGVGGLVSKATRERFSYELGSILTWQLGDFSHACHQWAAHRAAFPHGRYSREVQRAEEKSRCAP